MKKIIIAILVTLSLFSFSFVAAFANEEIENTTIQVEAERTTLNSCELVFDDYATFERAARLNTNQSSLTLLFDSSKDTNVTFTVRLLSRADSTINYDINGAKNNINVTAQNEYQDITFSGNATNGENTLVLTNVSGDFTIDYITLVGASVFENVTYLPQTNNNTFTYAPNNATLNGVNLIEIENKTYGQLDVTTSSYAEYAVYAQTEGTYTFSAEYLTQSTEDANIDVYVNNYKNYFVCSQENQVITKNITLRQGYNSIVIKAGYGNACIGNVTITKVEQTNNLRLEAEKAELSFLRLYEHPQASGGLVVGGLGDASALNFNSHIIYQVNAPVAGDYNFNVSGYNIYDTAFVGKVYVNGVFSDYRRNVSESEYEYSFQLQGNIGDSSSTSVLIHLNEGANNIIITNTDSVCYLDYFEIEGNVTEIKREVCSTENGVDRYEAENATIYMGVAFNIATASKNTYVEGMHFEEAGELYYEHRSSVYFNEVKVEKDGFYWLKVQYASEEMVNAVYVDVLVNGGAQLYRLHASNPAGMAMFNENTYVMQKVYLMAGNNQIRVARGAYHISLDYIEIYRESTFDAKDFYMSKCFVDGKKVNVSTDGFIYMSINFTYEGVHDVIIPVASNKSLTAYIDETEYNLISENGFAIINKVPFKEGKHTIKIVANEDLTLSTVTFDKAVVQSAKDQAVITKESIEVQAESLQSNNTELIEHDGLMFVKMINEQSSINVNMNISGESSVYFCLDYDKNQANYVTLLIDDNPVTIPLEETSGTAELQIEMQVDSKLVLVYGDGQVEVDKITLRAASDLVVVPKDIKVSNATIRANGEALGLKEGSQLTFEMEVGKSGDYPIELGITNKVGFNYELYINDILTSDTFTFNNGVNTVKLVCTSGSARLSTITIQDCGGKLVEAPKYNVNNKKNAFEYVDAFASDVTYTESGLQFNSESSYAEYDLFSIFTQPNKEVKVFVLGSADTINVFNGLENKNVDIVNGVATFTTSLVAGSNKIKLSYVDAPFTVEKIEVPFNYIQDGWTRYEAEYAKVTSGAVKGYPYEYNYGTYSGEGFVGSIDTPSSKITFTITVPEEGEYEVRISYASGAVSPAIPTLVIKQNIVKLGRFDCGKVLAGWGMFNEESISTARIMLNAGVNQISLCKDAHNVEVDYLEVGAKVGEYKDPSDTGNNEFEVEEDEKLVIKKKVGGCSSKTLFVNITVLLSTLTAFAVCFRKNK